MFLKLLVNGFLFNVLCPDYILTNCISQVDDHTHVLMLKQPSFVMLPLHANDPWFNDKGLQVIKEIKKALSREKRVAELVIVGFQFLLLCRLQYLLLLWLCLSLFLFF